MNDDDVRDFLHSLNQYLTKDLATENLSAFAELSRVRHAAKLSQLLQQTGTVPNTSCDNPSTRGKVPRGSLSPDDKQPRRPELDFAGTVNKFRERTAPGIPRSSPHPGLATVAAAAAGDYEEISSLSPPVVNSNCMKLSPSANRTVTGVATHEPRSCKPSGTNTSSGYQEIVAYCEGSRDANQQVYQTSGHYEATQAPHSIVEPNERQYVGSSQYESYNDRRVVDDNCYDGVKWSGHVVSKPPAESDSSMSSTHGVADMVEASFCGSLLVKVGQSGVISRRFCVLRGTTLMCFEPSANGGHHGIEHVEDINVNEYSLSCVKPPEEVKGSLLEFQLTKSDEEPIVFCTDDIEYHNRWIKELKIAWSSSAYVTIAPSKMIDSGEHQSPGFEQSNVRIVIGSSASDGGTPTLNESLPVYVENPNNDVDDSARGRTKPKKSKIKLLFKNITKKAGRARGNVADHDIIIADFVEVSSNLTMETGGLFQHRYCVVRERSLTCYADMFDSSVVFLMPLVSDTELRVGPQKLTLKANDGSDVTIKMRDVAAHQLWAKALVKGGATKLGCTQPSAANVGNPNQGTYEEIPLLELPEGQPSQAALYEEVGAVCERIHRRSALPPPIPSIAPPLSPHTTVAEVTFRNNSQCEKKSNDDYMIPTEISRRHGSDENTYMNVRQGKSTVKRSRSFEAEAFYLEMSKSAGQETNVSSKSRSETTGLMAFNPSERARQPSPPGINHTSSTTKASTAVAVLVGAQPENRKSASTSQSLNANRSSAAETTTRTTGSAAITGDTTPRNSTNRSVHARLERVTRSENRPVDSGIVDDESTDADDWKSFIVVSDSTVPTASSGDRSDVDVIASESSITKVSKKTTAVSDIVDGVCSKAGTTKVVSEVDMYIGEDRKQPTSIRKTSALTFEIISEAEQHVGEKITSSGVTTSTTTTSKWSGKPPTGTPIRGATTSVTSTTLAVHQPSVTKMTSVGGTTSTLKANSEKVVVFGKPKVPDQSWQTSSSSSTLQNTTIGGPNTSAVMGSIGGQGQRKKITRRVTADNIVVSAGFVDSMAAKSNGGDVKAGGNVRGAGDLRTGQQSKGLVQQRMKAFQSDK